MPQFRYECFCRLVYPEELTYDELLECERELTEGLQPLLTEAGAEHVDFFPDGDSLHVQCVFTAQQPGDFETLVQKTARLAGGRVQSRFLLVDKQLDAVFWGLTSAGTGRVYTFALPGAGEPAVQRGACTVANGGVRRSDGPWTQDDAPGRLTERLLTR